MNHVNSPAYVQGGAALAAIAASSGLRHGGLPVGVLAACMALAFAQAGAATPADALPQGSEVVHGQVSISQSGATMQIDQGSNKAIINWQSFDIGSQAAVNFNQPSAGAIALNRVMAGEASQISGQLSANGQVWIVNPAGVLFGAGSRVDVGGMVVSTLEISNRDFIDGKHRFERNDASARIENHGNITAAEGGGVALLAPTVINEGLISAQMGTVALAAGDTVTLDAGANGLLKVAVDTATLDTLLENRHMIIADGGQVLMSTGAAHALNSSVVSNTGTIQAHTLENRAGRILLLADMDHGQTVVAGRLDAGAPATGDGGFIETSAAKVTVRPEATISTKAAAGKTGTWLIDPNDYTIAASGGDISGADLSANLDSTNVVIESSGGTTQGAGDINVNDAVSWSKNKLTLTAARDININAVMTASEKSTLVMNTGATIDGEPGVAGGTVRVGFKSGEAQGFAGRVDFTNRTTAPGEGLDEKNLTENHGYLQINGQDYTVILDLGTKDSTNATDLQGINGNKSGHYALGDNINALDTADWNSGVGFDPIGSRP